MELRGGALAGTGKAVGTIPGVAVGGGQVWRDDTLWEPDQDVQAKTRQVFSVTRALKGV